MADIDTSSQEHMHRCLVRQVLAWRVRDRERANAFLDSWEAKHKEKNSRLRRDVVREWSLGNRGKHGDWRSNGNY